MNIFCTFGAKIGHLESVNFRLGGVWNKIFVQSVVVLIFFFMRMGVWSV